MPSEMEYINYKEFVESLSTTENPDVTDKEIISNETNGPRSVPANARALSNELVEGRVKVYNLNGVGFFDIKKVFENFANSVHSVSYINTSADAIAAFGEIRDVANATANTMYSVNKSAVVGLPQSNGDGGTLITFRGNTSGNSIVQLFVDSLGDNFIRTRYADTLREWQKLATYDQFANSVHSVSYINTSADAIAAFGEIRDVANATANTMYSVNKSAVVGLPQSNGDGGTLITFRGNTSGNSIVQLFVDSLGDNFIRTRYADTLREWQKLATYDQFANSVHSVSYINTSADAIAAFGEIRDVANATANTMYSVNKSAVVGLPQSNGDGGTLITFRGNTSGNSIVQLFVDNLGDNFIRTRYADTLREWQKLATYDQFANSVHSVSYINTSADAIAAFGEIRDVANATANTMYSVNKSAVVGLPQSNGDGGTLITFRGNTSGNSIVQLFVDSLGDNFIRTRYAGTLREWQKIAVNGAYSHIIPQFVKIGALGGSYTTGASDWKDADGNYHSVDHPELSWVQIWGRERGVQAFNFSHGGYSTKNWLEGADGLAKAQTSGNECKAYFILYGGGNDIRDYDGLTNLGSIADVHVGSEDENPDTYFGNYSRIIAALKTIGGARTKIFTFPFAQIMNADALRSTYNDATEAVCALYDDVFFIDIEDDEVINGPAIWRQYFGGHFSAYGYKLIADRFEYLVDKYVAEHPSHFDDIQWIGSDLPIVQP